MARNPQQFRGLRLPDSFCLISCCGRRGFCPTIYFIVYYGKSCHRCWWRDKLVFFSHEACMESVSREAQPLINTHFLSTRRPVVMECALKPHYSALVMSGRLHLQRRYGPWQSHYKSCLLLKEQTGPLAPNPPAPPPIQLDLREGHLVSVPIPIGLFTKRIWITGKNRDNISHQQRA